MNFLKCLDAFKTLSQLLPLLETWITLSHAVKLKTTKIIRTGWMQWFRGCGFSTNQSWKMASKNLGFKKNLKTSKVQF